MTGPWHLVDQVYNMQHTVRQQKHGNEPDFFVINLRPLPLNPLMTHTATGTNFSNILVVCSSVCSDVRSDGLVQCKQHIRDL
jgi:hypothetical protein